ncbi:hypothetical protein C8Q78DRAFT_770206 [Trametes maxima]|nr:hypothetical protein C8Q78DRAFT_770206 [Trametes maxima]
MPLREHESPHRLPHSLYFHDPKCLAYTMTHFVMQLNNYAQTNRLVVTWVELQIGPSTAPTWQCTAYVNGVQCGRGHGVNKSAAREIAAEAALMLFHRK